MPDEPPSVRTSIVVAHGLEPRRRRRFRWGVATAVAVPVLPSGVAIVADRAAAAQVSDCEAAMAQDAEKIRTERIATERELPGIGTYEQIHWRWAVVGGSACERGLPDQWEWMAEGVIKLRAEDAAALRDAYECGNADGGQDMPYGSVAPVPFVLPDVLRPYAPADADWDECSGHGHETTGSSVWIEFRLDAEDGYAYFSFSGDGTWRLMNPTPSATG